MKKRHVTPPATISAPPRTGFDALGEEYYLEPIGGLFSSEALRKIRELVESLPNYRWRDGWALASDSKQCEGYVYGHETGFSYSLSYVFLRPERITIVFGMAMDVALDLVAIVRGFQAEWRCDFRGVGLSSTSLDAVEQHLREQQEEDEAQAPPLDES